MSETRTVLVTGASQGIGAATARAFAEADWHVVLAARSGDRLAALTDELGEQRTTRVVCDVAAPEAVDALFARIDTELGHLDAVFNNAGVNISPAEIGDIEWTDWRHVVGVNLDGAFLVARGAFRMMKAQRPQGGRIINNGSLSAQVPRVLGAAYTASKHAITGLTKAIALDGRPYDIACGQIDVGNAQSAMTEQMDVGVPQADGTRKPEPVMDVLHVARSVVQMAELPLDANVQALTIMATKMPFLGRG
jgi:NAD(P)-dependent dehydrogenase (short-subunit alcohol dehydrogenase family)